MQTHIYRRMPNILRFIVFFIFCLLFSTSSAGIDDAKMKEYKKKIEVLTQKMAQCGSDVNCIKKLSQEMQTLSMEMQNSAMETMSKLPPSQTAGTYTERVPVKVQINHTTEFKHMGISGADRKKQSYEVEYYVFEYEAEEEGFLDHTKDFSRFRLHAPKRSRSIYSVKKPLKFRIIRDMGYRQSLLRNNNTGKYQLKRYGDGAFIGIDSQNKTFTFEILYPPIQSGMGNVNYGPIAILVRNEDTSCPDCDKSLHDPMFIDPVRFEPNMGDKQQFIITPDLINDALKKGKLQRTFRWRQNIDDYGGYQKDKLDVTVLLRATPGVLSVSPIGPFKSSGPNDKGVFIPSSTTYILKNTGGSAIKFSTAEKETWLNLSNTNGTLEPGASAFVKASIGPKASKLENGTYLDKIRFTNTTNGKGNTTRDVELKVGEEQLWRIMITGFEVDDRQKPTMFKDTDGSMKKLHKKLRFNWQLMGEFVLEKKKKQWVFKDGKVKAAKISSATVFTPSKAYKCKVVKCPTPNVPISKMIGDNIFGHVKGNAINIHWPPRQPSGCVSCQAQVPSLPKTPYEGVFESVDFTTQIGLEYFGLKDGWSKSFKKKDWLGYTVKLKRLK